MSRRLATALTVALLSAHSAHATSLIRTSDDDLVDLAEVVVTAHVEARLPYVSERPATDWLVRVDRVLKGELTRSRISVRLPGGEHPSGRYLKIFGTPKLSPGGEAILFLRPAEEGTFRLVDFVQGAFLAASTPKGKLAVRDLGEVQVLQVGHVGEREPVREFDRFADWIEDRSRGRLRRADYLVKARSSELERVVRPFLLINDGGQFYRWFRFDAGESIAWRSSSPGLPGLTGGGVEEMKRALAAWTNEANTPLRLDYGGISQSQAGLEDFDDENGVLWNDPNDEISGDFSCSRGGVVAVGSFWILPGTQPHFKGRPFREIDEGDIVVQKGIECLKSRYNLSRLVEEVVAHELGHTLGLDHSSENSNEPNRNLREALMYFNVKGDGRGSRLYSDDIAGIRSLYDRNVPFNPGSRPLGPGGCPANTLCLQRGRFQVSGDWSNQFDGSSGFAHPIPSTDLAGFFYFTDPSNVELIVKILDFGGSIKVFYSQLTNLEFNLRVTDTTTGVSKTYSNTPGDCGAIDQDFAAASSFAPSALSPEGAASIQRAACVAGPGTMCLSNNRFAVTVRWRNQFNGVSGTGAPRSISRLTGAFSFDDPANLEILLKILEFDGKVLVLWGSLSNFEYSIRITDTATGTVKTYENPAGTFCGGLDDAAF